jgi:hypothetical protein
MGLLIGGLLGGIIMYLLQQIRTGGIRIPPSVALGPVRLDTTGMTSFEEGAEPTGEPTDMRPFVETTGSAVGGCLSIVSAALVLIGFILPWFSCNLAWLLQGSFSGFSVLVQMIAVFFLSLLGAAGSRDISELGIGLALFLLLAITFVALIPIAGLSIARTGLRLLHSLKATQYQRSVISRAMTRAALIGLTPLICYLATAMANINFSSLGPIGFGFEVRSTDTGLWVTFAGFVVALAAGLIISITASFAEQIAQNRTD